MTPGLVDEVLAGMTRRHDLSSAFAARYYVMSTRRNLTFTKDARLGHKLRRKHSEPVQHRKWRKKWESHPRQVGPAAAFKAVSSSMPDFFHGWRRERDSHSRWGEPHLLSGQAPRLSGLPPKRMEMVRAPGNAPGPGTHLVRLRL